VNLEQQICSLELAKRLKALGVKQESYFYYSACIHCLEKNDGVDYWDIGEDEGEYSSHIKYSAFTVAELGEMLPVYVEYNKDTYEITICISDKTYVSDMHNEYEFVLDSPRQYQLTYKWLSGTRSLRNYYTEFPKEADARAAMLIFLIENKLIEVNK
jgi:hypothetical protein